MQCIRQGRGLRVHPRRFLQRATHEIADQVQCEKVQHDGADHLEHAEALAQPRSHAGPRTTGDGPTHQQKGVYSLTEKTIQLVPVFAHIGGWGRRHLPVSEDLSIRAEVLENGGPQMWADFMDELRTLHLGAAPTGAPSVAGRLQAAYEEVVARKG